MPFALLPNGQTTYVKKHLEVSVAVPGVDARTSIEKAIREELEKDPRQLFVRVQGGGGFGPWCFWIQWGRGEECCATPAILLGEQEHSPDVVMARIKDELAKLRGAKQEIH